MDFEATEAFSPVRVCSAAFRAACSVRQRSTLEARGSCCTARTGFGWATVVAPVEGSSRKLTRVKSPSRHPPTKAKYLKRLGIGMAGPRKPNLSANARNGALFRHTYWSDEPRLRFI